MAAANPNLRTAAGPSTHLHRLHLAAGCLDEFCADEWWSKKLNIAELFHCGYLRELDWNGRDTAGSKVLEAFETGTAKGVNQKSFKIESSFELWQYHVIQVATSSGSLQVLDMSRLSRHPNHRGDSHSLDRIVKHLQGSSNFPETPIPIIPIIPQPTRGSTCLGRKRKLGKRGKHGHRQLGSFDLLRFYAMKYGFLGYVWSAGVSGDDLIQVSLC